MDNGEAAARIRGWTGYLAAAAVVLSILVAPRASFAATEPIREDNLIETVRHGSYVTASTSQQCETPGEQSCTHRKLTIRKRRANGKPARRYGESGRARIRAPGGGRWRLYGMAVDSSGRLILAGPEGEPIRLSARGRPDDSFDASGSFPAGFTPAGDGNGLAVDSADRVLMAGSFEGGSALLRLMADGSPDPSFAAGGLFAMQAAPDYDGEWATAVRAGEADSVQLAGYAALGTLSRLFFAIALDSGGQPVGSFGESGLSAFSSYAADQARGQLSALIGDGRGRLLVSGDLGGGLGQHGGSFLATFRLRRNGATDASFGADGRRTTQAPRFPLSTDIARLRGGRVIVVSGSSGAPEKALAAVFGHNGEPEQKFAGEGSRRFRVGGEDASATSVARGSRRSALIVGYTAEQDPFLARVRANGGIDRDYGG